MKITRHSVAQMLAGYLRREIPLAALVDWAECAMMEADFDETELHVVRDVVARLGVADVRAFGLTWDDCDQILRRLGYSTSIEVVAV